jgi:N-acylneuraminate cytidylyltransferase
LFEEGETDSVITVSESNRNPYFNMTSNDSKGYSSLVIQSDKGIVRRQDAPQVFDMTTVAYVVDANFVKEFNGIFEGKVKSVTIPAERAIDIDTMLDFKVAECLLLN